MFMQISFINTARGIVPDLVRFCLKAGDADTHSPATASSSAAGNKSPTRSTTGDCLLYGYCFIGLNISYLVWGLLQEKIITQEYRDGESGKAVHFRDSQFLVFVNRALTFLISGLWLLLLDAQQRRQRRYGAVALNDPTTGAAAGASALAVASSLTSLQRHRAPLFKYSYASLSNILSAWFQYEALKFVSFPTQVLAKSCKIIPVMLMGRIVSRTRYEFYEYLTACLISLGMVCFLLGSADDDAMHARHSSTITTLSGVLLLTLYLVADSFTANWQSDLFRTYGMTPMQMMCGVSGFSMLFTGASLGVQGGFAESVQFAVQHPKFMADCLVLSASSAIGQLFIFYTIAKFGPISFTIIMTIRQVSTDGVRLFGLHHFNVDTIRLQAIAILLSCIVYDHYISAFGIVGIAVVFVAIFMRVYCNHRMKLIRRKLETPRGQRMGV